MLSFAASRLCGRARDGSLAAIMVVSPSLGRFHRGAGLFVMACPEIGGMGGKAHVCAARERLGSGSSFETEDAPALGEGRGYRTGDPPWGEGEDDRPICLNGAQ